LSSFGGRPRFLDWHLERLAAGACRLGFAAPDGSLLRDEILQAAPAEDAVVKLVLTRGSGARGYRAPKDAAQLRQPSAHRPRAAAR